MEDSLSQLPRSVRDRFGFKSSEVRLILILLSIPLLILINFFKKNIFI